MASGSSSSCSRPAKHGDSGGSSPSEAKASPLPPALVQAPHEGRVFVDRDYKGAYRLTDIVTLEAKLLEGGPWTLCIDEDSKRAFVAQAGGEDGDEGKFLLVDDTMQKEVFKDGAGNLYIVEPGKAKPVSFEAVLVLHRPGTVSLTVSSTGAALQLGVYVMRRPRSACQRVYWSLKDVYAALSMTSYKKQYSKWVWSSLMRWRSQFAEHLGQGHMILSNHANTTDKTRDIMPFSERFLDQPAMSTVGLLQLLCRWCSCEASRGGLREEKPRAACKEVLMGMIKQGCAKPGGFNIGVFFDFAWACRWPRANGTENDASYFEFMARDGEVDLSPLYRLDGTLSESVVARKWQHILCACMGPEHDYSRTNMQVFLGVLANSKELDSFAAQVQWALSKQIELILAATQKNDGDETAPSTFAFKENAISAKSPDLDMQLFRYASACVEESIRWNTLGIATDKANPCSGSICNTAFSFPGGKVQNSDKADDDTQNDSKKRKAPSTIDDPFDEVSKRQRGWLERHAEESSSKSWRAVKLHRLSAKWWLLQLDNQIKHSPKFEGLGHFNMCDSWPGWREWPGISLSCDLGADGVAAWHALVYKWKANGWLFPDESHSCKNSFNQVVRAIGAWPLWLVLLVSWNLEFGPRQEEARRSELRLALTACYDKRRPSQSPLFLELAPRMIAELEKHGLARFPRERPVEEELWEFLRERNRYGSMGRRVCMARYGATLHAALKHQGLWAVELWERTFVALEHGHITKRQADLSVKAAAASNAAEGSTNVGKGLLIEERAIKGAAQNAVGISVMVLEQRHHQRIVEIICGVAEGLTTFHTYQNKELRSIEGSVRYIVDMCRGGYMKHIVSFVQVLGDQKALHAASFIIPPTPTRAALRKLSVDAPLEREVEMEDECARVYGQAALNMVVARAVRGLWMYGWPAKMASVLDGGELASKAVEGFKTDEAIYNSLVAEPNQPAAVKEVLARHVLQLTSNRQLAAAISELGDGAASHPDLAEIVRSRVSSLQATQLIEDMNAAQSISAMQPCRKFRRPAVCMATVLEKQLVSDRHKFMEVEATAPPPCQRAALPKSAWAPGASSGSMPFHEIVSTAQNPSWYSTVPERMTTPVADLFMLRDLRARGESFANMSAAWLGSAIDVDHKIALGFRRAPGSEDMSWYIGLHYFPKSCVMLWPAAMKTAGNFRYFELSESLAEPILKPILSLDPEVMLAVQYEWRSWLWQVNSLPVADISVVRPAVRLFVRGAPAPFVEVACRASWFNLSRTAIADFASHFRVNIGAGSSLFEVLWEFCSQTLQLPEQDTLDIVHRRVAHPPSDAADAAATLLELDEATEVLEPQDVKEVDRAKEQTRKAISEHSDLRAEFVTKAREVRAGAKKRPRKADKRTVLPHHIEQADAKQFLPEDTSIWRSHTRGEWHAHYKPCPRVAESFRKHGSSEEALKEVLRRVWRQWLTRQGLAEGECPISGLFD